MKKFTHLPIYNNYLIQPNGSCSRFLSNSNLYFFIDNIDHFDEYDFYSKDYFTNRNVNINFNQFSYHSIISSGLLLINELTDFDFDFDIELQSIDLQLESYNLYDNHFNCNLFFIIKYGFKYIEYHKIIFSFHNESDPMFSIFSYIFVSEYEICNINIKKNKKIYLEKSNLLNTTALNKYYLYHMN